MSEYIKLPETIGMVILSFIVGMFLGILLGIDFGSDKAKHIIHKSAIEAGVAHYEISDPITGVTEFKWGSPNK